MAEKTATLTVEIPEYLVLGIQKQIAEGKFTSENEAIVARLQQTDDYSWAPDEPFDAMSDEEWEAEIERRMRSLDQGTMETYSLKQFQQRFAAWRETQVTE